MNLIVIVLGALLVSFLVGKGAGEVVGDVMANIPPADDVRRALREEAANAGIDPDWLDAIAYNESRWQMDAVNLTSPGDLARGGAYGPTQITLRTARDSGYDGDIMELTRDAHLAGYWSCVILNQVRPKTFADACAYWNAGKPRFDMLPADHVTVTDYWPAAQVALSVVENNPIA